MIHRCVLVTNARTIWITPWFAAAFVRQSSPSGWPSFPSAVADYGAIDERESHCHQDRVPVVRRTM